MELITTTVSVDAQKTTDLVVIHIVKGDSGTRRFQFVPIEGGHLINMLDINGKSVDRVKMIAYSSRTSEPLEIDCTFDNAKRLIYMVPTPALVANVDEWACQLVMYDDLNRTLTSMPFDIIVHGTVFEGDTVEHTNNSVLNISYNTANRTIILEMADNTVLTAQLPLVSTELDNEKDGLMSIAQCSSLETLITQMSDVMDWLNQSVKTTASPTFANLTVGSVSINGSTGVASGLRFT